MKVNRQVLLQALQDGLPVASVVNRQVGKTTKAIFAAIADSYDNLNNEVLVDDPDNTLLVRGENLFRLVARICQLNNLTSISVKLSNTGKVFIVNSFAEEL